jgi:hypothetical protein
MIPATAVGWGSFVQAAYDQYAHDPGQPNPATITNMPAGYTLLRTIQMTDFLGPVDSRVFYGFVAVGGDPASAVVALRGTRSAVEWWDDLQEPGAVHSSLRWRDGGSGLLRPLRGPSAP